MPAERATVALKYWLPAMLLPVPASRRKALLCAPMCVTSLYATGHSAGELLHTSCSPVSAVSATSAAARAVVVPWKNKSQKKRQDSSRKRLGRSRADAAMAMW